MDPQCTAPYLDFPLLGRRELRADVDGGSITSDGGAPLPRTVEQRTGIIRQFAAGFTDHRDPDLSEHTVVELYAQRVDARALGYEGLNDHDDLRRDPPLAAVVGKADPTGPTRQRRRDRGKALAGQSTLTRLELTPPGADQGRRPKKITGRTRGVVALLVALVLRAHRRPPGRVVLDRGATDDPVRGHQLGRFVHGYYKGYCHHPLSSFCGDHRLCARPRPADLGASAGAVKQLERVVARSRRARPEVTLTIRGDSGSCRGPLMAGWERNGVDDGPGLARGTRRKAPSAPEQEQARPGLEAPQPPARVVADHQYRARDRGSRARRVVAKAGHRARGAPPRFVVTSRPAGQRPARAPDAGAYCGRGEAEDRIEEQQHPLVADRTSAHTLRAHQVRLFCSPIAYVLLGALRRPGLAGTGRAAAPCPAIRVKRLKIGALVRVTVRTVRVRRTSGCPYAGVFRQAPGDLSRWCPVPLRC